MIGFVIAAAASSAALDPGPQPSWAEALAIGNRAILERMIDPESARIQWPYTFFGGSLKGLLSRRRAGWITCGTVNARNRMGGYAGTVPFLIVIRAGQVVELDIGEPEGIDTASATCPDLIRKGLIRSSGAPLEPSASPDNQVAAARAEVAAQQGGLGVSFYPSEAGLVLLAVAPGSPAANAGLRPGQVIERANGIDLKRMPQAAAIAILKGLPNATELELAGGARVKILRP